MFIGNAKALRVKNVFCLPQQLVESNYLCRKNRAEGPMALRPKGISERDNTSEVGIPNLLKCCPLFICLPQHFDLIAERSFDERPSSSTFRCNRLLRITSDVNANVCDDLS